VGHEVILNLISIRLHVEYLELQAFLNYEFHVLSWFTLVQNLNGLTINHWLQQVDGSQVGRIDQFVERLVLRDQRLEVGASVHVVQRKLKQRD